MLLGMPFLAATNLDIDWPNGKFIGQIHVRTTDAHEWRPEKGSKEEGLCYALGPILLAHVLVVLIFCHI